VNDSVHYLAAPYSDPNPQVREKRYESACRAAAELTREGKTVIAPTVYGHHICRYGLPTNWQFWQKHDERLLGLCDEIIVLTLPGWRESIGVNVEIAAARTMGKPVTFMEPVETCSGGSSACP
jgi:hypothetical protein